jgi:hypothetical protein
MDIEGLSKSQLVLLTILVNFVTSVATGVLTVSLLDYAPPYVTQTVNRVVNHTIETVAQAAPSVASVSATPAPSNQDLVTAAIGAAAARLVGLYPVGASSSTPAITVGSFLPKSRMVVTAAREALPKDVLVTFADGSTLPASLSREGNGIALYGFADGATFPSMPALSLVAAKDLRLGETALTLGTDGAAATGIVSRVWKDDIRTTLPSLGAGTAVVDLSGNLIGIVKGSEVSPGALFSADLVGALLSATSSASITGSS